MSSSSVLLREHVYEGYGRLRAHGELDFTTDEAYRKQIEYELSVFEEVTRKNKAALGYGEWADFLLVTADYANWARNNDVVVGGGRGSAAGSLVCLCLGITTGIDPIRYRLIFERFLNPARVSVPDIDLDFSDQEKVFQYLEGKYGKNRVVRISAPQYLKARGSLKKAGEVLGMQFHDCIRLTEIYAKVEEALDLERKFKDIDPAVLDAALDGSPELKQYATANPKLWPLAKRFIGLLSGHSTHPAGALICHKPAGAILPLMRVGEKGAGSTIRTAWDCKALEKLGWVKCDILSVTNLQIITESLTLVRERHGVDLKPHQIPQADDKTSALFRKGDVVGIFQISDNQVAHRLCRELPAETVDDVSLINALIRPGIEWEKTVENKREPGGVYYPVDALRDILRDSYGVFTYQEQIMFCVQRLARFTMEEADQVRRVVATTSNAALQYDINEYRQKFIDGCQDNGITLQAAQVTWEQIKALANYCFNKAHAVSYGILSWQEGFVKARWPAEYLCACLNDAIRKGWREYYDRYTVDARKHGIVVYAPDVNRSKGYCFVDAKGALVLGLRMVKHVGSHSDKVSDHAPYKSYRDFCERSGAASKAVKVAFSAGELFADGRIVEVGSIDDVTDSLMKAGAFDSLHDRRTMLEECHPKAEVTAPMIALWEQESIGFFLTANPLLDIKHLTEGWIQRDADPRRRGTGGGLVAEVRTSPKGHGFIKCRTSLGTLDLVCWADDWQGYKDRVKPGIIIRGELYKTRRMNFAITEIEEVGLPTEPASV